MKKLIYSIFAAFSLIAFSCSDSYDDSYLSGRVDNLEQRVKSLEEICKQININISSLQTLVNAMQDNDFITGVNPLYEGDTHIGYTIDFAKSESITIYHGKDGADGNHGTNGTNGKDGADGYTPTIGIAQDSDGHYYWTLDGEWLLDNNGQKVLAEGLPGKDGQNGSNGSDGSAGSDGVKGDTGAAGKDGKDGITPTFKIENDYWFISYDNGATWTMLGKATGENGKDGQNGATGPAGADGKDGEAMFSDIDTSDPDFVIFTLLNGTQIKLPTWYAFEDLKKLCEQMNTNISSLQTIIEAVQDNDYLVSVTPIMEDGKQTGYTLNFAKAGAINIYHGKDGQNGANGSNGANGTDGKDGEKGDKGDTGANGKDGQDGHTPVIGVKEDGGVLYWTVDGEFLLDSNQNKIPVTGKDGKDGANGDKGDKGDKGDDGKDAVTPQFKIESGDWYVSTDGGLSWQNMGKATGDKGQDGANGEKGETGASGKDGADGDSFFESVTEDDNYIHIKLKDSGETIDIPKNRPMDITFSETEDIRVEGGKTYKITYTVTGVDGKATVKAYAQDGYRAQVEAGANGLTGTIHITTPSSALPSEVLVFASDGSRTIMRSINFVADIIVVSNKTYYVGNDGATVEVEVLTNLDYTVEIASDAKSWVTNTTSRAILRTDRLSFTVAKNENAAQRTATIELKYENDTRATFLIIQHAGVTDVIEVPSGGGLQDIVGDNKDAFTRLELTGHLNIYDYEFIKTLPNLDYLDLSKLDDTTMPENCLQNSKISTVILPEKLTAIPDYAFDGASITSIIIPETVLTIGKYAFNQCTKITGNLVIPDYVTSIGQYAFCATTFDGTLTLGSDLRSIGNHAFYSMNKIKGDIRIPDNVISISKNAFQQSKGFDGSIIIGEGCTTIGEYAFAGCSGLKGSITIGNAVTQIPDYCFLNNSNMVGPLIIGESVESVGLNAFEECSSLTGNLIIPDNVTTISRNAFYKCMGFNGVLILGKNLTFIGRLSFCGYVSGSSYPTIPFEKVISRAEKAPSLDVSASSTNLRPFGTSSGSIDLYIPKGATGYSSTTSYWYFNNIYEVDTIDEEYDSIKP